MQNHTIFQPDSWIGDSDIWLADDDTDIDACLALSIASLGLSSKYRPAAILRTVAIHSSH